MTLKKVRCGSKAKAIPYSFNNIRIFKHPASSRTVWWQSLDMILEWTYIIKARFILPANANAKQMLTSQNSHRYLKQLNSLQRTCESSLRKDIVEPSNSRQNSLRFPIRRKYEPGFSLLPHDGSVHSDPKQSTNHDQFYPVYIMFYLESRCRSNSKLHLQ